MDPPSQKTPTAPHHFREVLVKRRTPILRCALSGLALWSSTLLPLQPLSAQRLAGKLELETSTKTPFVGQRFDILFRVGIRSDLFPKHLVQPFRRPLGLPIQIQAPWLQNNSSLHFLPSKSTKGLSCLLNTQIFHARPLPGPPGSLFSWFEIRIPTQAQTAGPLRLSPTHMLFTHASSFREDFANNLIPIAPQKETIQSPPLSLKIQTLPPKGTAILFSGAVGKFNVQTELGSPNPAANSLRLHLHIQGTGDLSRIRPPILQDIPAFRFFHVMGQIQTQTPTSLTITYDLTPIGNHPIRTIPPIPFSYFDPDPPPGYQLIQSKPIPLHQAMIPRTKDRPSQTGEKTRTPFNPKTALAILTLIQGFLWVGVLFLGGGMRGLRWSLIALLLATLIPEGILLSQVLSKKPQRVLILQEGCPLLQAPHMNLPPLRKLRRGDLFHLIEGSDHWLRIRVPEGEGWVSRFAVRIQ